MAVFKDNWQGHSYLNQRHDVKATTSKLPREAKTQNLLFPCIAVFPFCVSSCGRGWRMDATVFECLYQPNLNSVGSRCWSFALRKSGRLGFFHSQRFLVQWFLLCRFGFPEAVNGFNDDVQSLLLARAQNFMSQLGQPINFSSTLWGLTAESECWRAFMASEIAFGTSVTGVFGSSRISGVGRLEMCFFSLFFLWGPCVILKLRDFLRDVACCDFGSWDCIL